MRGRSARRELSHAFIVISSGAAEALLAKGIKPVILPSHQFGGWTIYHSGDTVRYEGMSEKLRPFKTDVVLLPINGRAPERRVPGNLFGREAAQLAKDIEAKLVIPCHFEMFEFNTAPTDEFVHACRKLEQPFKVYVAANNGTASLPSG